jgi:glycosyltransferase involved in cell wall biosynthesis
MATPFFSVVIPTYNRAGQAVAAVKSVLWQTEGDFECLVVDDGSRDDTRARLERIKDPRLHCVFNTVNQGQHACRNQAIRGAKSDWIAFLDSDDLFLPRRLEEVRAAISGRPSAGFWFTNSYVYRYNRIIGTLFDPARPIPEGRLPGYYALGETYLPYVTTMVVVRRDAFLKTGYFRQDLRMLEDTELYTRMIGGGLEVGALRQPSAVRFLHEGNITQDHRLGFVESVEALRVAGLPAEKEADLRKKFAWDGAEYFWKSLRPELARELLLKEVGPEAQNSPFYLKTFIPTPLLRATKAARKAYLQIRHHPLLSAPEVRDVYRQIEPLLDEARS